MPEPVISEPKMPAVPVQDDYIVIVSVRVAAKGRAWDTPLVSMDARWDLPDLMDDVAERHPDYPDAINQMVISCLTSQVIPKGRKHA